jgi:putative flippase GtrA
MRLPRSAVLRDAFRFGLAGLGAAAADLGIYALLLHAAGWHPLAANLASRPCGGLVSFTANKLWTFRARRQRAGTHVQFGRFWLVWLAAYVLSELALALWLLALPRERFACKLLAEATVSAFSFLAHRHWTFD